MNFILFQGSQGWILLALKFFQVSCHFSMIFIKFFKIPWYFQVFQVYPHFSRFSRFSRSSGNHVLSEITCESSTMVAWVLAHTPKVLYPCCLWVQKIQTNSFAYGGVGLSAPSHDNPTTKPTFTEWQSTLCRSPLPLKILGRKAKSNHLGDSNESPMKRTVVVTVIMFSGNEPLKRSPIVQIEIVPPITE